MNNQKIAIIGLGYVGLPLAVEFGKKFDTIGFDTNLERIQALNSCNDITLEIDSKDLQKASRLSFTNDEKNIIDCNIYIITVPTPIDINKRPNLSPLINASATVGKLLNKDDIVIYESTVYPGATEEVCVPILEQQSGLEYNKEFYCGYSPERINPGDKKNRLTDIIKITSGSTLDIAEKVDYLYSRIIKVGTHKAGSIRVAEAAKVIENTQRDVNIALVNELALIFNKLNIDTEEVLKAAETKWNFHSFRPGLVGGHCIGVDPYYLTYKAIEVGYHPEVILAGRRLNDNMGVYIADQVIKLMTKKQIHLVDSNILIMGFAFKENCTDLRNTRVIDLIEEFKSFNCNVDIYDPWVIKEDVEKNFNIDITDELRPGHYDAIIIAVAHNEFLEMTAKMFRDLGKDRHVLYDVKCVLNASEADGRL